jgi:hypothetical protein
MSCLHAGLAECDAPAERGTPLAPGARVERVAVGLAIAHFGIGLGLGIDRASAEPAEPEPTASLVWQRVAELPRGNGGTALAVDAASGEIAVGDASGVLRVRIGGRPSRILRRSEVRDLLYLDSGALLAATAQGLYRIDASGRVHEVSPGPGAEGRPLRLAAAGGVILVATEGGAFLSLDAQRWHAIVGLASGPVAAAAIRARAHGLEGFVLVRSELYRVEVELRGMELVAATARREAPSLPGSEEPIDVIAGLAGADLVLLTPTSLVLRDAPAGRWRAVRPALPPGAAAHRLAEGLGRLWLATDRGLLEAPGPAGPWRRVAAPSGSREVGALVATAGSAHAVIGEAVYAAGPARRSVPRAILAELPVDPPIERVHRAALDYLDLGPARIGGMRRGVERRGWLPRMVLAGAASRDRDRGTDVDEVVTSGSLYRLVDQGEGRSHDGALSLAFTWELGDLLYHSEEIDISREAREVIELRDDVLDELTQLYFERRRVLIELAAAQTPEEALRLRLRAAELAAGIDAWTGGWFSRALRESGP